MSRNPSASPTFGPEQMEEVFLEMLHLRRRGWTQPQIAQKYGVSQNTVSKWLKKLRKRYEHAQVMALDAAREETRDRYRELMRESWEQFERSKLPLHKDIDEEPQVRVCAPCMGTGKQLKSGANGALCPTCNGAKTVKVGGRIIHERTERCGDPKYLVVIEKCLAGLRKLDGLDAPIKVDVKGQISLNIFDAISGSLVDGQVPDEIENMINQILGPAKKVELLPGPVPEKKE